MQTIKISEQKLEQFQKQLGKLRSWHTGWADAGKMSPPGSKVLWQLEQMLRNKEAK